MNQDQIYLLPLQSVGDFEFDARVVDVFPDMIARSVPGYGTMLLLIEQMAGRFARPGTRIYDLGCSLGAATRLIRRQAPLSCTVHAVDNSPAMIERLKQIVSDDNSPGCPVETQEADIRYVEISSASLVVLNLTLQFIPPSDRSALIAKIFRGLEPGGALVVSEKICFEDSAQQELLTDLHHAFKRAHGYSELEIVQKRAAIERRLIPETSECHLARLRTAGFDTVIPLFQCFNFASFLAVRSAPDCVAGPVPTMSAEARPVQRAGGHSPDEGS